MSAKITEMAERQVIAIKRPSRVAFMEVEIPWPRLR
jgi:hypothetical protein